MRSYGISRTSRELINEAGLYADRLSVNVEIPTAQNLKLLAPDKNHESVYKPMSFIHQGFLQGIEEKKRYRNAPRFAPAGQSTQMIIGATDESDKQILTLSSALYKRPSMKRVYYSGFIPVNSIAGTKTSSVSSRKQTLSSRLAYAFLWF